MPVQSKRRRVHAGRTGVYYRETVSGRRYEFCYQDSGGRLRWQVSRANSLRAAEAERGDLIARMRLRGEEVVPNRITFEEAAEAWRQSWDRRSRRKLAPSTRRSYNSLLEHHAIPLLGRHKIQKITPRLIAHSIREVERRRPKSASTYLAVVRGVFSHAFSEGWIVQNPVARLRPEERPEQGEDRGRVLEPEAMAALLAEATREPHRTILLVLCYAGLRMSEALGLRWRDVAFDGGFLRVRQQYGPFGEAPLKTKNSRRDVVLAPQLALALKEHRLRSPKKAPDARVFTLGARAFEGWFDRLTQRVGLNEETKLRRHDLRHTWGWVYLGRLRLRCGPRCASAGRQRGSRHADLPP